MPLKINGPSHFLILLIRRIGFKKDLNGHKAIYFGFGYSFYKGIEGLALSQAIEFPFFYDTID